MNQDTIKKTPSYLSRYFAFIQRRSKGDKFIFYSILLIVLVSFFSVLYMANTHYLTASPSDGGTLIEGIVGTPRFINPVLAITRADHDIVALIYSGILRLNTDGDLVPNLAESVTLSEDGKTYHVVLRKDVQFHNGDFLNARDVAYTIALIQDPDLKSPLRGNWYGVIVEEISSYKLNIILSQAYPPFLENLTVGILPRSLWDGFPTEQLPFSHHNTNPVGTGPYMINDMVRNKSGIIETYKLTTSPYSLEPSNIDTLVFHFYNNEDELIQAMNNSKILSTPSLSPSALENINTDIFTIIEKPVPRIFAIFFNQNRSPALRDKAVRQALNVSINRNELVDEVLFGRGIPIIHPIPPGFHDVEYLYPDLKINTPSNNQSKIEQAKTILLDGGWEQSDLGFWQKEIDGESVSLTITLSTANNALFNETAIFIKEQWDTLGVQVRVDQFEYTDLVQHIIRPRNFEALLFGNDTSRSLDLYPFWHSSQKNDPGLNISQYTNIDIDTLLERIQNQTDVAKRTEYMEKFINIIKYELPAIFLFTPTFTYVINSRVSMPEFTRLSTPSERFANISQWHINEEKLWSIFTKD